MEINMTQYFLLVNLYIKCCLFQIPPHCFVAVEEVRTRVMFAVTLYLIICVQGLFAFHSLRNNHEESYRMCLKSLTDKWFDKHNFVYVLSDTNDDDISYDIPRSKIIVNPKSAGQISSKINIISNNFVMVRGVDSMHVGRQILYLWKIGIFSQRQPSKYKFFIVNHEKPNWEFYKSLWFHQVYNAVVLVRSSDKPYEEIKWYWSNPFTAANGCGNRSNVIEEYKCTDSAKVAALKAFRGNKDCPVPYIYEHVNERGHHRIYSFTILDVLQKSFNMHITVEQFNDIPIRRGPLMIDSNVDKCAYPVSQEYFMQRYVWIVPVPKQLSLIEIYFVIFQKEVWLMVAIGFGIALLLYVALVALHRQPLNINRIIFINLEILSLTVWGSYSRNPKIRAVCVFLLCYSFYATVIQTGYVSGLIRVLTIPQFEKGIETLEELADSSIPVYTMYSSLFERYNNTHEIIRTILPRVIPTRYVKLLQATENFRKYNNISILTTEEELGDVLNGTMNMTNMIFDTSLFGHYAYTFFLNVFPDHHFMYMLDKSITALKENGIGVYFESEEVQHRRSLLPQYSHPTDPQVLTMGHLYGIFVIYGFGICISCIVFVLEIVTKYYYNRKRFTPVQVLNADV